MQRLARERVVAAAWGESAGATYPVEVEVQAADRTGLLRDISEVLTRERIGIVASAPAASDAAVRMRYSLEVADLRPAEETLQLIQEVRGVARAARR